MQKFQIEYKGFTCEFSENDESWMVIGLDNFATRTASLKAAKAKIDDILKEDRKVKDLPAFLIPSNTLLDGTDIESCVIFLLAPPEKGGYGDEDRDEKIRSAWVRREKKSREKVSFKRLAPADAAPQIEEAKRLSQIAVDARKAADDAWLAIPRLTAADIIATQKAMAG